MVLGIMEILSIQVRNEIKTGRTWAQKKARVPRKTLFKAKSDGGLAVPDAMSYYVASLEPESLTGSNIKVPSSGCRNRPS